MPASVAMRSKPCAFINLMKSSWRLLGVAGVVWLPNAGSTASFFITGDWNSAFVSSSSSPPSLSSSSSSSSSSSASSTCFLSSRLVTRGGLVKLDVSDDEIKLDLAATAAFLVTSVGVLATNSGSPALRVMPMPKSSQDLFISSNYPVTPTPPEPLNPNQCSERRLQIPRLH
ncbi:hypothetical protein Ae201684_008205 [Aphanomyces euteiches]|uniref:Uncharacterized protein n=1 Tax=Aphanomyces euteiches TaxID=100861 RepID=A0A6G0X5R8_9STRA|nr:hypothetical protein Ae201684_008205 [Aphanomyces euteiches]